MVSETENQETSAVHKKIWAYSWPLLGLMLLNFLVGYTDVYVAGLLDATVQASVGFASQQYFFFIIFGNAVGVGTVAIVSQSAGRQFWTGVHSATRHSLLLGLSMGIFILALLSLTADRIVHWFDLPAPVRPMAGEYLRIYAWAIVPNYMIIIAGASFRAVGKPLLGFQIMTLVTSVNVGGNFLLVFGMGPFTGMGYTGIAWATVLSMTIGAMAVLLVLRGKDWKELWTQSASAAREDLSRLVKISWPSALLQIAWNAGNLALYHILGKFQQESVAAMAAYTNGLRLESITYLPAFALNMAAAVLVGQSLGRGDKSQAVDLGRRTAKWGAGAISIVALVLYVAAPRLARMLSSNEAVFLETVRYLRINLLVAPIMVVCMVLGGAMQGAGDTRGVMTIIVVAIWMVRIPLASILSLGFHMNAMGVWIAMDISMLVQSIWMIHRYSKAKWCDRTVT